MAVSAAEIEPRGLTREQAARYAGCETLSAFNDWVRCGILPGPISGTRTWDKLAIGVALEAMRVCGSVLDGHVYFIEQGKHIKIGFSRGPEVRLAQIQAATPHRCTLIATVPGSLDDEQKMHALFSETRVHGEWFEDTPALRAYIAWLKAPAR